MSIIITKRTDCQLLFNEKSNKRDFQMQSRGSVLLKSC